MKALLWGGWWRKYDHQYCFGRALVEMGVDCTFILRPESKQQLLDSINDSYDIFCWMTHGSTMSMQFYATNYGGIVTPHIAVTPRDVVKKITKKFDFMLALGCNSFSMTHGSSWAALADCGIGLKNFNTNSVCWEGGLDWWEAFINELKAGSTVKQAFDTAEVVDMRYAACTVFTGEGNLTLTGEPLPEPVPEPEPEPGLFWTGELLVPTDCKIIRLDAYVE